MFIRSSKNALLEKGANIFSTDSYIQYMQNNNIEEYEGIYKGYRRSYGFVVMPDDEDIYVEQNKGTAMHNDKVRGSRRTFFSKSINGEGVIVDVIERANETIVGTYDRQQHFGFVIPDDDIIGTDIFVDLKIH